MVIPEIDNTSITPKKTKILIVEDEAIIASAQKKVLKKYGYSVTAVHSGKKAVKRVRSTPDIDIILMDINLGRGRMDGIEAAEAILEDHDIPILFLSSYAQPEMIERTEKVASYGYIVKDSGETALDASIRMTLKLHEAHRKIKQTERSLSRTNERLELAQKMAGIGIWDWDIVTGSAEVTPEMFRLFGQDPGNSNVSLDLWRSVLHPEDRQGAESRVEGALKEHTLMSNEYRIIRPDGEIRWISALGRGIYNDAGNPVRMVGTCIDITERKLAEETVHESEKNWRSLVEVFPECILVHGKGVIHYVNPAGAHLLGCDSPDDVIGRSIWDIIPKDRLAAAKARVRSDEASGMTTPPMEYEFVRFDGSTFMGEIRGTPILYGGRQCVQVILRDITERKKAEEKLQESEKRYRQLVENTTAIILRIDLEGRITFINDHAQTFFGYPADEILGQPAVGTIIPERESTGRDLAGMVEKIVAEPDRYHTNTNENIKKSGERAWLEWTNSGIYDKKGKLLEFLAVGIDVTERRQVEQALRESEARLRAVLDNSPDAIFLKDRDSRLLLANPATFAIIGKPPEACLGKTDEESYDDPATGRAIMENDRRIIESGRMETVEETVFLPEGNRIYLSTKAPFRDEYGNIVGIIGLARDITEQKLMMEELRQSEENLSQAQKIGHIGVWQWDTLDDEVQWTSELERIYGLTSGSVQNNQDFEKHVHPDDIKMIEQQRDEAVTQHKTFDFEFRIIRPDGETRWVHCRGGANYATDGKPIRVFGLNMDITDRKRAEEELRKSRDELELRVQERTAELVSAYDTLKKETEERWKIEEELRQAHKMEAIGTLAGGIAHDFNNMLAAIIGFTEMVIEDVPDLPLVERNLKNIMTSAIRGRDLVKQILAFSRKTSSERGPIKLSPVVEETVRLLRSSIPATIDVSLSVNATPGTVIASPVEVQQIIMNLATNALLAMENRKGSLAITLTNTDFEPDAATLDRASREYLQITVRDTGMGMPPGVMKRVFEPFFTTRQAGKGSGMGLAMVYGIVKDLGGMITVESTPGRGSTFRVLLPKANREIEEKIEQALQPGDNERVLFVDDEKLLCESGKESLERLGYVVTVAGTGAKALKLFSADPSLFDLVITDHAMPRMSGSDLCVKLLRIRHDIPIILCTGHSETITPEIAQQIGIREFLMKPLTRQELAAAIRRVLGTGE